jgi:hypothetical protein
VKFLIIGFICCLCSCDSRRSEQYTGADTAQIITQLFNSKKIIENIPPVIDTIHLIKSKKFIYYNDSWPRKIGKLSIAYIDETPENMGRPHFGSKLTNQPIRYVITKFSIIGDTANVNIYSVNFFLDYYSKLIKKNNNWEIVQLNWAIE